jgi:uncharacterized protein (DUF1697 family)
MRYVALLRGINVGGKSKVEMTRLKAVFESAGCSNVTTYINSGNVIFDDMRPIETLTPLLEAAVAATFKLEVPIVLRSQATIEKLCKEIPKDWTNDSTLKTDVMFLWPNINDPSILQKVVINPELENVRYIDGALVWSIGRQNVTRGNGIKLIKTDLYKYMTIRNINTVRKLGELMKAAEA